MVGFGGRKARKAWFKSHLRVLGHIPLKCTRFPLIFLKKMGLGMGEMGERIWRGEWSVELVFIFLFKVVKWVMTSYMNNCMI